MKPISRSHITLNFVALVLFLSASALAGSATNQQEPGKNSPPATASDSKQPDCPEADSLRKDVQRLTAEVTRLRNRVTVLEKDRLVTTIQDQLTKEEQRGEALQMRLIDIGEKEGNLQRNQDQLNQQLRPEAIERALAGFGSVHPEEAREEMRRRLTSEKVRLQSQLDLVRQDKVRTQSSLATTDASIQRLRQKLAEAQRLGRQ
jgi:uncharacterized protein involved in exopolysaccharide biosynthesis